MNVEKFCDELRGGLKVLSNWEISRSPRNIFWDGLRNQRTEVELLDGSRGPARLPVPTKLRMPYELVLGGRLWGIISMVKRETPRTAS